LEIDVFLRCISAFTSQYDNLVQKFWCAAQKVVDTAAKTRKIGFVAAHKYR